VISVKFYCPSSFNHTMFSNDPKLWWADCCCQSGLGFWAFVTFFHVVLTFVRNVQQHSNILLMSGLNYIILVKAGLLVMAYFSMASAARPSTGSRHLTCPLGVWWPINPYPNFFLRCYGHGVGLGIFCALFWHWSRNHVNKSLIVNQLHCFQVHMLCISPENTYISALRSCNHHHKFVLGCKVRLISRKE
jgi:hypothetical protein